MFFVLVISGPGFFVFKEKMIMDEVTIYGLITRENPLILVIGSDEKKVMAHPNSKEIGSKIVALFKCNEDASMTSFTAGFEPTGEHYKQVREYVKMMLSVRSIPVCELNAGCVRVI